MPGGRVSIQPAPMPASLRCRALAARFVSAVTGLVLLAGTAGSPARAQAPERIVVAGGVITEVIYALGQQERVVGVDSTSQFPHEALKEKANIGYVRVLSAEGVLSLKPSLIMLIDGAGPPDAISLIKESGVRAVQIDDASTPDGVAAKIEAIGNVVGATEPARRLAAQTRARFDELATLRDALKDKRRVLFVLSLQNGRVLVGGRNTQANAIIQLSGGVNVASEIEGYKPMTDEAIVAAAPDAVVMMRHASTHNAPADELFALPAFSRTPAAAKKALVRMDGLYLLGFGPRAPLAARDLMAAIYPEAAIPPLKTATAP